VKAIRALIGLILAVSTLSLVVDQLGGITVQAAPQMEPAVAIAPSPSPKLPPRIFKREKTPKPDAPTPDAPAPTPAAQAKPKAELIAHIPRDLSITTKPGRGRVIGTMPSGSKYFGEPIKAWVMKTKDGDRYGKVTIPWSGSRNLGWIDLKGVQTARNPITVHADLSEHRIRVKRFGKKVVSFPAATGASSSPTPPGRYFVTDRVDIPGGGSFGTYAFGLSGIQTNLPPGWTGGDQLAIHGTSDPGSIGTSASAGCLRVSEGALDRLKPLLVEGTPVIIKR
jgi:lipoprotein-anchoring transpeptidase ErfK/SrfK